MQTARQVVLAAALVAGGYLAARYTGFWLLYPFYGVALIAMSRVDLRERRIPNRIVYLAILVALGAGVVRPGWPASLAGGLATGALFLAPVLIFGSRRAGIGDVKLGLFVGLALGFSWSLYWALLVAFGSGLVVGLAGILLKKWDRKSLLPFGPFLALGMGVAMLIRVLQAGSVG